MLVRKFTVLIFALFPFFSSGQTYSFDAAMFNEGEESVDISLFNDGIQLPGQYYVSVYVNGNVVDRRYIDFRVKKTSTSVSLMPCILSEWLSDYGFDTDKFPDLLKPVEGCVDFSPIPQADISFDFNQEQLAIVVPPQNLVPRSENRVSESLWDDGIAALLMDYQVESQLTRYKSNNGVMRYDYIKLHPGINAGAWRLRGATSWQRNQGWQRSFLYAERGIRNIKSRLTLGESYTSSFLFDSVPFTGGRIGSDESMLSHDQWSYSPVIRGIARTQARVEIRQNGYVIANSIVPPGTFELMDVSPGSGQGTLDVTVYENDGSRQDFSVPYNTPAVAVRQGYLGFNLASGIYRPSDSSVEKLSVNLFEMKYGLPWDLTFYGGGQLSDHYYAGGGGIGAMMGKYGSVSADVIVSNSKPGAGVIQSGHRVRVNYSKFWDVLSFNAVSEFMSDDYKPLVDNLDSYKRNNQLNMLYESPSLANKSYLNFGFQLGKAGYINFSGTYQRFNRSGGESLSYGASYNTTFWKDLSFNLGWVRNQQSNRSYGNKPEDRINLWLSIPVSRNSTSPAYASLQGIYSTSEDTQYEAGMYGRLLDGQLWWDIRERFSGNRTHQNSGSVSTGYRGVYGEAWGGYNRSTNVSQLSGRINGKVILSKEGITAGQDYGDTVALIKAPGASGLSVGYLPGLKTDPRGYAIIGGMNAYRKNVIDINPEGLPEKVSLLQTSATVVPTRGAVVLAPFRTSQGERILLTLIRKDQKPVPFGAVITFGTENENSGIAGDNGEVYLTGVPSKTTVTARWGKSPHQVCQANINLSKAVRETGVQYITASCV